MKACVRHLTIIAFIIIMAIPVWGQQYTLYVPQHVVGQKPASQDGILVQNIEIRKGDTLFGLSRKFSGRGMYFPQILLFNSIKNPNLIHPGDILKIPVSKYENETERADQNTSHKSETSGNKQPAAKPESQSTAKKSAAVLPATSPGTELSLTDLKAAGTSKNKAKRQKSNRALAKKKPSQNAPAETASSSPRAASTPLTTATGQKLYEAAVKAYRKDDCRNALELFDRYLADNSSSPLAADANLYKADCYLKLSAQ